MAIMFVLVITFYSPRCLGQETSEGPGDLQVMLPHAHLSTLLNAERQAWKQ